MIGGGVVAALLACQMASQAYGEENERKRREDEARMRYTFPQLMDGCSTSCPNTFITGVYR